MLLRRSPFANSMPMYSLSSRLIRLNFFPTLVPSYGYFIQSGAITYGTDDLDNADVGKEFVFRYLNVILIDVSVHIFIQSHIHDIIKKSSS